MRRWHGVACMLGLVAIVGSSSAGARLRSSPEFDLGAAAGWSRFNAPALGMSVDYPANVFAVRDGAAEQGEGQRFRTSDGRARLSVYALENEEHDTPAMYLKKYLRIQRGALAYRRVFLRSPACTKGAFTTAGATSLPMRRPEYIASISYIRNAKRGPGTAS